MTLADFRATCDLLSGDISTMEENFITKYARKQIAELRARGDRSPIVTVSMERDLDRLDSHITFLCDAEDDAEA